MGFLDNARKKAAQLVDQHGDKIDKGIGQAASAIDKRTGGKHTDKITKATAKAREGLDKLDDGKGRPDGPAQPGQPGPR